MAEVWIDDKNHTDFDREKLIVNLPETDKTVRVRVRIEPTGLGFSAGLTSFENEIGTFTLDGNLCKAKLHFLKRAVERVPGMKGMILDMSNLNSIDDTGWDYLLFTKQQRGADFSLKLKGLNDSIAQGLKDAELDEEFTVIN